MRNTELAGHLHGLRADKEKLLLLIHAVAPHVPPDAVFSHLSAALLLGIPITTFNSIRVEVVWDKRQQTRKNLVYRTRTTPASGLTTVGSYVCTDIAHTLIDLAIDYPLTVSVPALDYALHNNLTSIDELRRAAQSRMPVRALKKLQTAVKLSEPLRESVGESLLAVGFHTYGIPGFEWQVNIFDRDGNFLARVDAANREAMVVAEFDGAEKYGMEGKDPMQSLNAERKREYPIRNLGYSVFRFKWDDLWKPDLFRTLKKAIAARTPNSRQKA